MALYRSGEVQLVAASEIAVKDFPDISQSEILHGPETASGGPSQPEPMLIEDPPGAVDDPGSKPGK